MAIQEIGWNLHLEVWGRLGFSCISTSYPMLRILEPKALYHDYVPPQLPNRELEYSLIRDELKLASAGLIPGHLLLLGPPGSGKTVTILKVLRDLAGLPAQVSYIVAAHSPLLTLDRICEKLLGRSIWGYGLTQAWDLISRSLGDRALILVIDELDKLLVSGKGDELIYYLTRRPNTCLIGISNLVNICGYIRDPRARSSFVPQTIGFSPYTAPELIAILELRARLAFGSLDALDDELIPEISRLALRRGGDARYAIDLLKGCVEICIQRSQDRIRLEYLDLARERVELEHLRKGILCLREPQKLLLSIISRKGRISISELVGLYNTLAQDHDLDQLSSRWISNYLSEMEKMGLIQISPRGYGRARGVRWWVELGAGVASGLVDECLRSLGF